MLKEMKTSFRWNLLLIVEDESHSTVTVYVCFNEKEQRCSVSHFSSALRALADKFSASFNPRFCFMKSASLLFVTTFFSGTSNNYVFRADLSCFLLAKVPNRNLKCALTDATEIKLTDIVWFIFSWFPSSLAHSFLQSTPTRRFATRITLSISESPAKTYEIRPLSLLARKTILMLLRYEGGVVLMSWRRSHL